MDHNFLFNQFSTDGQRIVSSISLLQTTAAYVCNFARVGLYLQDT